MKRIIFITIALLCVAFQAQSQETEQKQTTVKYSLIVESGFQAGWDYVGFEHTVVNGIRINDKHAVGFGLGFGTPIFSQLYCPIYANYRYYFNKKDFSPHVNVAFGGVMFDKGGGLYSTITSGFRFHRFSFSSGMFFQGIRDNRPLRSILPGGCYGYSSNYFSWGFVLKAGVTF